MMCASNGEEGNPDMSTLNTEAQNHRHQLDSGWTVAIIGLGLIGGSLGMAWRTAPSVRRVIGVVRRPEAVDEAVALGACDEATLDARAAAAEADIVVVCTPMASIVSTVTHILPAVRSGTIITDVGSTKAEVCNTLWDVCPPDVHFIGGHPMAGSEKDGIQAADPYLFENAVYVLTPPPAQIESGAVERLTQLVREVGALPMLMDPERHDTIVAAVSHVPHLAAAALVYAVDGVNREVPDTLTLAAGGFRDTTRIASGLPSLWREISLSNRQPITQVLRRYIGILEEILWSIENADGDALEALLKHARDVRQKVPNRSKGIIASLFELVVEMVDRPGEIAAVTSLLAKENVNLIDIEILRVREGEGGTVRLGFESDADRDRAMTILRENGYRARAR